jgi:MFS transporter, UMF1 family
LLNSAVDFMIIAALTGIAQGGVQSLSRSYFAKMVPIDGSAEYFGFLNLVGKCSAFMGPWIVGGISFCLHSAGISSVLTSRIAMSSIVIFFAIGAIFLIKAESFRIKNSAVL